MPTSSSRFRAPYKHAGIHLHVSESHQPSPKVLSSQYPSKSKCKINQIDALNPQENSPSKVLWVTNVAFLYRTCWYGSDPFQPKQRVKAQSIPISQSTKLSGMLIIFGGFWPILTSSRFLIWTEQKKHLQLQLNKTYSELGNSKSLDKFLSELNRIKRDKANISEAPWRFIGFTVHWHTQK